jgi:hypothetical protein
VSWSLILHETLMVYFFGQIPESTILDSHSSELMILVLFGLVVATLIVIVPQLLRAHLHKMEMLHAQNMRALEQGLPLVQTDERSHVAGRAAMLVPMVVVCAAATVTCFLVAYKSPDVFTVSLAVWVVSGIVSLAAITGGVALIGRLAQLQTGHEDNLAGNPLEGVRRSSPE